MPNAAAAPKPVIIDKGSMLKTLLDPNKIINAKCKSLYVRPLAMSERQTMND